ncbi:MAG: UDP-N-acetylmuramate dehydrogenase [Actinomycetota bacterium]|nr:UDP-N-acetylmuramate dehydrogenase [Actinomycetota bacterium]
MKELQDIPLAALTTMRVGGPARRLVIAESIDEIVDTVRECDDADEPLLVFSGGSNLVIADEGFAGSVLRIATTGITVESNDACGGVFVRVAAGESWDDFVAYACRQGWSGIEALSGIPGLTGATPVQNVGAYGQDVSQTIASVRVWDRREECVRTIANADARFSYRHSMFKDTDRYVVLDVLFQLRPADRSQPIAYADLATELGVQVGDRVLLDEARTAVLAQRARRGMVLDEADHDTWSCGSFFTNPILSARAFDTFEHRAAQVLGPDGPTPPRFTADEGIKTAAAWLIDKAGFGKSYAMPGPAALSTKHTLAITNRGTATAADITALAREIRDGVHDVFGITLVAEPVMVGHTI